MENQIITDSLFSRKETAEYLHIGLSSLGKLAIPKIRIRRRVLYRMSDIKQWLDKNVNVEDNKNE